MALIEKIIRLLVMLITQVFKGEGILIFIYLYNLLYYVSKYGKTLSGHS